MAHDGVEATEVDASARQESRLLPTREGTGWLRKLLAVVLVVVGCVALLLTYRVLGYWALPGNVQLLNELQPNAARVSDAEDARVQAADALRLLVPLAAIAWVAFFGLAVWLLELRRRARIQKGQEDAALSAAAWYAKPEAEAGARWFSRPN